MPSTTAEKTKADSPDALIARVSTAQQEQRQRAADDYRTLLLQGGDAAALHECMVVLGRTAGDLEGDRELVRQVLAYEQAVEQRDASLAAYEKGKPHSRQLAERVAKRRVVLQKELDALKLEEEEAARAVSLPLHVAVALGRQLLDRTAMDAWAALVAGVPLETYVEQKRRRRMAKYDVPPPVRARRTKGARMELIVAARDEYRDNERCDVYPAEGRGEMNFVNKLLSQSAESVLRKEEVKQFAIRDGRQEEKDREARVQRDTDRRKAKLEAGKSATE